MIREAAPPHLSQISTAWTVLFEAHHGAPDEAAEAKRRILERYGAPAYRYLLAATRDRDRADELYQDFALKFIRGDLHRAHPDRGRFRFFLKTTLSRMVIDDRRRRIGTPTPADVEVAEALADPPEFLDAWRSELLARAWDALADLDRGSGGSDHALLRLRVERPEIDSAELARLHSAEIGRPVSATAIRKRVLIARRKFADLLLEEIAASLDHPTPEAIEDELIDVGLLNYCHPALDRRRGGADPAYKPQSDRT